MYIQYRHHIELNDNSTTNVMINKIKITIQHNSTVFQYNTFLVQQKLALIEYVT